MKKIGVTRRSEDREESIDPSWSSHLRVTSSLGFGPSDLFRISSFEFRISLAGLSFVVALIERHRAGQGGGVEQQRRQDMGGERAAHGAHVVADVVVAHPGA